MRAGPAVLHYWAWKSWISVRRLASGGAIRVLAKVNHDNLYMHSFSFAKVLKINNQAVTHYM
jgi:hypothetical protein